MATTNITQENHDDTVKDGIVLLDFWAEWCGPCKRFGPIFEQTSEKYPDVKFGKIDTEAQTALAAAYGVTSIPMIVAYRDGIPVFGQAGALPAPALEQLIAQVKELDMDVVREQHANAPEA